MKNYHAPGYRRNKKPPTDFDLKGKTQRIARARALIERGAIVPYSNGQWLVDSNRINSPYKVTIQTCQCADFLLNRTVCKHRWAVIAAVSVLIIERVLVSASISDLEHVRADYRQEIDALPTEYRSLIESSYNKRLHEVGPHTPPTSRELRRFITTRAIRLGEGRRGL